MDLANTKKLVFFQNFISHSEGQIEGNIRWQIEMRERERRRER